jgi:hypothetical protein
MKCRLVLLAALTFPVWLVATVPAQDTIKDSEYYPLPVGTTWEYLADGQKIVLKVAKIEMYNGVQCAVIETSFKDTANGAEHISVGKDGVFRHSMNGEKVEPAARILKLPFKSGDSWKIASKFKGINVDFEYTYSEAEITVPAGKFKTIVAKSNKFTAGNLDVEVIQWYAKGVGMVKTATIVNGKIIEVELSKFTAAK